VRPVRFRLCEPREPSRPATPPLNVRAVGDKAASIPVAERFGERVEEVLIDNGHRAHAPEPYLNASPTGEAVATALR
jgi:hypothetical protein